MSSSIKSDAGNGVRLMCPKETDLVSVWFCFLLLLWKSSIPLLVAGYRTTLVLLKWNIYLEMIEKTKLAKRRVRPDLEIITVETKG